MSQTIAPTSLWKVMFIAIAQLSLWKIRIWLQYELSLGQTQNIIQKLNTTNKQLYQTNNKQKRQHDCHVWRLKSQVTIAIRPLGKCRATPAGCPPRPGDWAGTARQSVALINDSPEELLNKNV